MNISGQTGLLTVMIGVVIIILALALTPIVKTFVDTSRNNTQEVDGVTTVGLGCDNATITTNESTGDYISASCVAIDLFTPTFMGILIAVAGAIIVAKLVIGEV